MIFKLYRRYRNEDNGIAAIEFALILPVMLLLMMGLYDLGNALIVNQKMTAAAHMIGDLISRETEVDTATMNDIIGGGRLAIAPYDDIPFGYDITSVEFDADENPEVLWRVADNMTSNSVNINSTAGLSPEGEGVVIVTVAYEYAPMFAEAVLGTIEMRETSFLRGRKSAVILCTDCEDYNPEDFEGNEGELDDGSDGNEGSEIE